MDDSGRSKKYTPLVTREQASSVETHKLLSHIFQGKATLLVSNLIDTGDLTKKDLQEILEMKKDKYADPAIQKQQKQLEWQESGERGEIERNFGVGKRRYGLDCIVTKLKETNEVMIHASVLYMNLRKKLKLLLRLLFSWLWSTIQNRLEGSTLALA